MFTKLQVNSLRMERQHLARQADEREYLELYRDTQPGQNVYWNGFGDPPSITFRAAFDDKEYNRARQESRALVKGRFLGGNLGWVMQEDMELFTCLCRKPLANRTLAQQTLLELIEREGPLNIQQMKELTGMLVKEITPVLHRLQEAFFIYEDQYNGEWDRGWYRFSEMFPHVDTQKYTRQEALQTMLRRFAFRNVLFDSKMAKSFFKLPEKEITTSVQALVNEGILCEAEDGYVLTADLPLLESTLTPAPRGVFAMHRNDFLVKSNEHRLKEKYRHPDYDSLQYLLIDGEFSGVVLGHFKNGPYMIEDVVTEAPSRDDEILQAVYRVNDPELSPVKRFNGVDL
ncbi:MAG: hypothetical protein LBS36_11700 [Oscillospiraceae bacterium]|jgi:hypothetical protein|nr:hypothetical protein [Oscillospiraceae bacterium]